MHVLRAAIVVFVSSFCLLVIELVAGRILAPYVGVSLYTWTSIIGVVLAGLSAGAWAGGWLADKRPKPSTLGFLLLASGAAALLIGPATTWLAPDEGFLATAGIAATLLQRVVLLSILIFFIPSFLLGMISPVAVKLAVHNLDTAGSVVGRLYALSTLGSIAGTFTTGFYLVARYGTRATLIGVGITLIACALLFGDLLGRRTRMAVASAMVGALLVFALRGPQLLAPEQRPLIASNDIGVIHSDESQYYTIQVERTVRDDTGAPLLALHLDHLVHSYADLDDPSYLEYGYLRIFKDVIDARVRRSGDVRLLFIGGGGYTLPRLLEKTQPGVRIDVVEIDPEVTRTAARFFGLPRTPSIRTVNEDARWYAMRAREQYDVIVIDAFNDLSVPYHLTTREFASMLRRLLAPDGTVVVNLIDDYKNGRFLPSYIRTLQEVFGESNVALMMESEADMEIDRSTFVVAASPVMDSLRNDLRVGATSEPYVLPDEALQLYVLRREGIVLTDDFAPVDNMLAPLFTARFADEAQTE